MTLSVGQDTEDADCKCDDYLPRIYSGVFNDIRIYDHTPTNEVLFLITDFPFSLVLDTLVLPYTITTQVMWGNICPSPINNAECANDNNL